MSNRLLQLTSRSRNRCLSAQSIITSANGRTSTYSYYCGISRKKIVSSALLTISTTSRPFSSTIEPPNLFKSSLDTPDNDYVHMNVNKNKKDKLLRSDVKALGAMLGQVIQEREAPGIFESVEELRGLAKEWRASGKSDESFNKLTTFAAQLSNEELKVIARAFTHFLALANTAEAHHRVRRNEEDLNSSNIPAALPNKRDSVAGVLDFLVNEKQLHPKDIHESLCKQMVELVLTAHPTEVNRRTLIDKFTEVKDLLIKADALRNKTHAETCTYAAEELQSALQSSVSSIWQSDEVAKAKPTPQEEAHRGTLVLEQVLWQSLPDYLKRLDYTLKSKFGQEYGLPLDACPIKFSSWMGGDRDGNPNVTPDVTRDVVWTNRLKSCKLIKSSLNGLYKDLSLTNCSQELRDQVGEDAWEPYRDYLTIIYNKVERTSDWAKYHLQNRRSSGYHGSAGAAVDLSTVYTKKEDLLQDLMLMHRSLCETNNAEIANNKLSALIRNVASFGLSLCALDIRQESTRHTEALDAITRYLGYGSYADWDETTKISWLSQELTNKRPLLRKGTWMGNDLFSDTVVDTLETFDMIAECHEGSLGAYVISQATTASDVMAVLLLQKNAGVSKPLRVAPLFETLDDLRGAADTMEILYTTPAYVGSLDNRRQEIMIGYSDSAKDAGRLAASWAQIETQERLAAQAKRHNVELTFFHGKGGTVGRGGNPSTFNAILSHAPGTINGRFRVTEQGEMIYQNFGHTDRATRTLDIYTAAILQEYHCQRAPPSEKSRKILGKISDLSCEAYRAIVRGDERFVPYFRSATPEQELTELKIGSRPAKRRASGGVESLRAIPWIFAWTQTRLNLPTWLGVGEALTQLLEEDEVALKELYATCPSFRTTIDLVEMVLAKSEPSIAKHYDDVLVTEDLAKELGAHVRKIHLETEQAVLNLTNHDVLGEGNELLLRILTVRNPYVDVLNVLQAETLKRLRGTSADQEQDDHEVLKSALLTTITGIANGMGNTG